MPDQNQMPAADPGNPFLSTGPCGLTSTVIDTPEGQRLMLTIRTPSTTLTVFLEKSHGQSWIDVIKDGMNKMTSLTVAPANIQLPPMNGHPHG